MQFLQPRKVPRQDAVTVIIAEIGARHADRNDTQR